MEQNGKELKPVMPERHDEIVIYQSEDGQVKVDVLFENETVWLTQQQMSMLFQKDRTVITRHISNIFSEGELDEKSNVHFLHFPLSDKPTKVYNLDVIISVGYRVKSQRGTQFRRWATKIIRDYTLKGYAVNQRILAVEEWVDNRLIAHERRLEAVEEKIDFFIRTNMPPVEQVFFNGQFFEARVILEKIIKTAKNRVIVIDAYIDASTFEMLDVRGKGVKADIYSGRNLSNVQKLHNTSSNREPIDAHVWKNASHDRWLIIDNMVYHCGHSLKDMGQKLCAIAQLDIDADDILKKIR